MMSSPRLRSGRALAGIRGFGPWGIATPRTYRPKSNSCHCKEACQEEDCPDPGSDGPVAPVHEDGSHNGPKSGRKEKARKSLEAVGLGDRIHHRPTELSGGQQQRVAIARALVNDPAIVMADEPTGNLDSKVGQEIMDLLLSLNKENGTTLVIITHDAKVAEQAQRIIRIQDGRVQKEAEL